MGISQWVFGIALKKVVQNAVKGLAAGLIAGSPILKQYGIEVSVNEAAAVGGAVAGLELLRGILKQKFGWKWL